MDYGAAKAFFDSEGPYLLGTHRNADGDGIGAMLALGEMLDGLGRECRLILAEDTADKKFAFLPGYERIEGIDSLTDRPRVRRAVFLDTPTASPDRVGAVGELPGPETKTLIIDHHMAEGGATGTMLVDTPNC